MIIIFKYQQQKTGNALIKGHYFKNNRYQNSSDAMPLNDFTLRALLKGERFYGFVNVARNTDLDYKEAEKC